MTKLSIKRYKMESALLPSCFQILAFEKTIFIMRQFLPHAEVRDVHYEIVEWRCCAEDSNWRTLDISGSSLIEIIIPAVRFQLYSVLDYHFLTISNKHKTVC